MRNDPQHFRESKYLLSPTSFRFTNKTLCKQKTPSPQLTGLQKQCF